MGGMAQTCGAVTGAMMVIGLKYGRTKAQDNPAKEKTRNMVKEFVGEFNNRHRSTNCRELLGCDISIPEGMEQATKEGLFDTLCPGFILDAVEVLEQIL